MLNKHFFVPTFEENGNIYPRCGFFIQSIFTDRNNNFQQNFFHLIENIDFLSSKLKRYFTSDYFL